MPELFRESTDRLRDYVAVCFIGVEFEPAHENDIDDYFLSGSTRCRRGFDIIAGCGVEVFEAIGMVAEDDGQYPTHRISAVWDDDTVIELDLDSGELLLYPEEDDSIEALARDRAKLVQALDAVEG